ncbi:hypothetical protein QBC38DRAFT_479997 [Podospora fimiseda]|uniref:DNA-directed RNA polymerase III subunit RPC6 n=1 Tax=Podospora fimiseda TaxID=252190 RepID=A0AAN7BNK1_9PEZI|nr:hypothetical protein QBC38DRAFT_479997 [Podospora fimiseda]
MASVKPENDDAKIEILKNALYDAIIQHGSDSRLFSQSDLFDLNVIPNGNLPLLLRVIQALTNDKLLIGVTNNQGILAGWRYRSREDAKKYTSLPDETTVLVYQAIDEAGNDGIWKRTIENRVNITDAVMKTCIKILEQKGYIASMRSVENPNRKMYIRADLRPSDRATGGPWFNENGELDDHFIQELQGIVFEFIKEQGAYHQSKGASSNNGSLKPPKNGAVTASPSVVAGTKRPAQEMASDNVTPTATPVKPAAPATRVLKKPEIYLPRPAGYKEYPTIPTITQYIHDLGITSNVTLGESDIKQLVDILVYDGVVEKIKVGKRLGYRVIKPTKQCLVPYPDRAKQRAAGINVDLPYTGLYPESNGLTEAPCAKCPVFSLCEEGGTVSPSNCVYFLEWLGLEKRKKGEEEGEAVNGVNGDLKKLAVGAPP